MRLRLMWAAWVTAVCLTACGGGGGGSNGVAVGTPSSADSKSAALGSESPAPTAVATKIGEAKSGEESALRPLATSPFQRSNTYELYAANGSQKLLRLDYSTARYEILDTLGHSTSGTFSEDANEPGTYIFASERIASTNSTARFRVTAGAVVGAFPFERYGAAGYATVPFVAANDFVTEAAQLDGDYNRLGISLTSSGALDSQILSMRLSGGGAQLEMCWTNIIYRISQCPAESKRTYALAASTESRWIGTNVSNPSDVIQFRMARINGQNVYLFAGWSDAAPDTHVLRIGLKDSPDWPTARYIGGATDQTWGANVISNTSSSRTSIDSAGMASTLDQPVAALAASNPVGIRSINASGTQKYFATKNSALSVVVGTRNPGTQGYIQVNLFDREIVNPNGTLPPFSVAFEPAVLRLTMYEGQTPTIPFYPLTARVTKNAPETAANAYLYNNADDIFGLLPGLERVSLYALAPDTYGHPVAGTGYVPVSRKLLQGQHTGALPLRLCKDTACTAPYPSSESAAWPYEITVRPPIQLTLEIDGSPVSNPPVMNGGDPMLRTIDALYGAAVTIRASEAVGWAVLTSGMTASGITTTPTSWTGRLQFPPGGSSPPAEGLVFVRATSLPSGDSTILTGQVDLGFHVVRP